jgi:hypothetical protein
MVTSSDMIVIMVIVMHWLIGFPWFSHSQGMHRQGKKGKTGGNNKKRRRYMEVPGVVGMVALFSLAVLKNTENNMKAC